MEENDRRIKEKLGFFFEEKIEVHIRLKDKTFLNGVIIHRLREEPKEVYLFQERKLGNVYLFPGDIYGVEEIKNGVER